MSMTNPGGGSRPSRYSRLGLRHLESQRSLLSLGKDSPGLSALAKKLRLAPNHHVAVINAPPGFLMMLAPAPADLYTARKTRPSMTWCWFSSTTSPSFARSRSEEHTSEL